MYIKIRLANKDIKYINSIPSKITSLSDDCWFFVFETGNKDFKSYGMSSNYDACEYAFKTREDVEKLIEDMIACENRGLLVYDLDIKIKILCLNKII